MKRLFGTGTPWIQSIPADKVLKMTHLDWQKRFPKNRLAFLLGLDEVGMTLVNWLRVNFHCELIQHPENPLNRS